MTDTSIQSPIDWGRLQTLAERIAGDVRDTWTVREHIDRLGMPPAATARLYEFAAAALGHEDSDGYTAEEYLGAVHWYWGRTHDEILTQIRTHLREHDPRRIEDGDDDGFAVAHAFGHARARR